MQSGLAVAQPAPMARPMGGVVVAGQAGIAQSPAATVVTQSSPRAVVDWRSFDVGSQHSVTFAQPGASAVVLNRVTGPDPSAIAGRISANGQVVITNAAGVVFHAGSQVDAQSLVVSTPGISTTNFMAGRMVFDQPGRAGAQVVNEGAITVREAGLAALVAPSVANRGVISARMGRVVLAGAEAHTLDMYGDGMLAIDVTKQVRQAPTGADGRPVAALVTNTGTIRADGGVVQLTASAADGIVRNLVEAGGVIRADSVGGQAGRIEISGTGGSLVVEGQVLARGRAPGTTGGSIAVAADGATTVAAGARISASGQAGGGRVAIGSDAAGGGLSARTVVQAGATVSADARAAGPGGRVTVLSGQSTRMSGRIGARGGPGGGDGGFVEVSGRSVALDGHVDVSAPRGALGTILIDPVNLTITAGVTGTVPVTNAADPNLSAGTAGSGGANDTVTKATIEALTGNVRLQASNDLTVQTSLTLNGGLTLEAGRNLTVVSGVTLTAGSFISLSASAAAIAGATTTGALSVLGNLSVTAGGIALRAGSGGMTLSGVLTASSVDMVTTGAILQSGGALVTGQVTGSAASAVLDSAQNKIDTLRSFDTTTGGFSLTSAAPLSVGNVGQGGPVFVPNGQTIALTADSIAVNANTVASVNPPNTLSAPGGTIALQPLTAGRPTEIIGSGPANANALSLNAGARAVMNAGVLRFGSATSGAMVLAADGQFLDLVFGTVNPSSVGSARNGAFGTVVLLSGQGITQNGILNLPVLSGSAAGIALASDTNFFTAIGDLSATGPITITGQGLRVQGPVRSPAITLTSNGDLTLAGDVQGSNVRLVAIGSTGASGSAGNVLQSSGTVTAGTLTGVATAPFADPGNGRVELTGANRVTTLGNFASDGDFALTNAQALHVSAAVGAAAGAGATTRLTTTSGGITLGAASLIDGLAVQSAGAVTQDAGSRLTGSVSGSAASLALDSAANRLTGLGNLAATAGDIAVRTSVPMQIAGLASVPGGRTLSIAADVLSVQSPGALSAPGGTVALAPVTAGVPITVTAADVPANGALALGGVLPVVTAGTLQLGSPTAGPVTLGGANEALDLTPRVGTLRLLSAGAVTQGPGASLAVPVLAGRADSITLGGQNRIGALGDIATTSGLTVTNAAALAVTGPVSDGTRVALTVAGDLALAGDIAAPAVVLAVDGALTQSSGAIATALLSGRAGSVSLAGANRIAALGPFFTEGDFLLRNAISLAVVGAVDPGDVIFDITGDLALRNSVTGNRVGLFATGAITQTGAGAVIATTLEGRAASATLTGPNAVARLGDFATTGALSLSTDQALAVTGAVSASAVALTGPAGIDFAGQVAAGALRLDAGGDVVQSGGALRAASLQGRVGGTLRLGTAGLADIGTLAELQAGGTGLTLNNAGALVIAGRIAAPALAVSALGALTLADGSITTGGLALAAQSGTAPALPGSYLQVRADASGQARFVQSGRSVVQAQAGRPALRIDLPGQGGSASFANLDAAGLDLVLALGAGSAGGTLRAGGLLVLGGGGGVNLTGAVAGIEDGSAAAVARILPAIDPRAFFNGCIIASVTCRPTATIIPNAPPVVVTPDGIVVPDILVTTPLPALFPASIGSIAGASAGVNLVPFVVTLGILSPSTRRDDDDPELPLPNVSERDF